MNKDNREEIGKDRIYILLKKYFEEQSFVKANLDSFNNFIDIELQRIINENKEIEPTIIPPNVEEFKIRLDKIWITKPEIIEADGSKRKIFPIEARLRKLSYAAPMFIEISSHINGVQRESFTTQIGSMPIMLKSKYCHLHNIPRDELIKHNEDPDDCGGYFIINGTEKVLVNIEDLSANKLLVDKGTATSEFVGKLFSESGPLKILHTFEKLKDGVFYITFTRVSKVPIIIIIKALGLVRDEDIMHFVSEEKQHDELAVNLYQFANIKTEDDALDWIAKKIGIAQAKDIRIEKTKELLDRFLFPHLGGQPKDRLTKAYNLCKMLRRLIMHSNGELSSDDKDHYSNKKLRLAGDLLADLMRVNLRILIGDLLYNFQRIIKRGKFPSIKVIIRDKLLTQRIYSSMATGSWVGGRKGVSQRMARINYIDTLSHLQRVASPLSATQENFEARALHCTNIGRLCPIETPEGTNIGLKKNLALLANITQDVPEKETLKVLKGLGLKQAGV